MSTYASILARSTDKQKFLIQMQFKSLKFISPCLTSCPVLIPITNIILINIFIILLSDFDL